MEWKNVFFEGKIKDKNGGYMLNSLIIGIDELVKNLHKEYKLKNKVEENYKIIIEKIKEPYGTRGWINKKVNVCNNNKSGFNAPLGFYNEKNSITLYLEPIVREFIYGKYTTINFESLSDFTLDVFDDLLDFINIIILHEIGHAWDKRSKGFLKETEPTSDILLKTIDSYINTVPKEKLDSPEIYNEFQSILDDLYKDYENEELRANKNGKDLIKKYLENNGKLLEYFEIFDEHIALVVKQRKERVVGDLKRNILYKISLDESIS